MNKNKLIDRALGALQQDYILLGKTHILSWHAWLILGLAVGITTGIIVVANRSGEFEPGKAATSLTLEQAQDAATAAHVLADTKAKAASDAKAALDVAFTELTKAQDAAKVAHSTANDKAKVASSAQAVLDVPRAALTKAQDAAKVAHATADAKADAAKVAKAAQDTALAALKQAQLDLQTLLKNKSATLAQKKQAQDKVTQLQLVYNKALLVANAAAQDAQIATQAATQADTAVKKAQDALTRNPATTIADAATKAANEAKAAAVAADTAVKKSQDAFNQATALAAAAKKDADDAQAAATSADTLVQQLQAQASAPVIISIAPAYQGQIFDPGVRVRIKGTHFTSGPTNTVNFGSFQISGLAPEFKLNSSDPDSLAFYSPQTVLSQTYQVSVTNANGTSNSVPITIISEGSTPPPPICGNGVVESGEQCDGNDFGATSKDCKIYDSKYFSGLLKCTSCKIDTGDCKTSASQEASSPTQTTIEGTLSILHADYSDGTSKYFSSVTTDNGTRIDLHFAGGDPQTFPASLQSGERIRVSGTRVGNELTVESGITSVQVMAAPRAVSATAQGTIKLLVILVTFQDHPNEAPMTVANATNLYFGSTNSLNTYYREASYGQSGFTGKVVGPFTIPMNTSCGIPDDIYRIADYADQAAAKTGENIQSYDRIQYVFTHTDVCAFRGAADVPLPSARSWINGNQPLFVVAHEEGHNYGLWHSHAYDCSSGAIIGPDCVKDEYGDSFDVMGGGSDAEKAAVNLPIHLNAIQKQILGWVGSGSSAPIFDVTTSGTYTISPLETVSPEPRALRIPIANSGDFYSVEVRGPIGFDMNLFPNMALQNGVVVHYWRQQDGDGVFLLDQTPDTISKRDSPLAVGKTFNDPLSGIKIKTTRVDSSGAAIDVSLGSTSCVHNNPGIAIGSGVNDRHPGEQVSFTVAVSNLDSVSCEQSTFDLQIAGVPSDWSAIFPRNVTLRPGEKSAYLPMYFTSSASSEGFFSFLVSAINQNDRSKSASNTFTAHIFKSNPFINTSILPSARAVQVGQTATAFLTAVILPQYATQASNCTMFPTISSVPIYWSYQETDPATNVPIGSVNSSFDFSPGLRSFVFAITPFDKFDPTEITIGISCSGGGFTAPVYPQLNTFLLSASVSPVPDIVAVVATPTNNGIIHLTNGVGAFSVATTNVGAGSNSLSASVVFPHGSGLAALGVTISICQTNPANAQCISPPSQSFAFSADHNAQPTFSIFVTAPGTVPFDPVQNRIYVQFSDNTGAIRGRTSVAVTTN